MIERWGIKNFELLQYVKEGLQPFYKGSEGLKPQMPPEVVEIESSIKDIRDEMAVLEKDFDSFQGHSISIEEWREFRHKTRVGESAGAVCYSDGSTDWIRKDYMNMKENLRLLEERLGKYQDLPSWKNYTEEDSFHSFNYAVLCLENSFFKMEDIEDLGKKITDTDGNAKIHSTKKSRWQEDKSKAIEIARKHIDECKKKGEEPEIADGIHLVRHQWTGSNFLDKTIRGWIKKEYPPESHKPGRKPGWRKRKAMTPKKIITQSTLNKLIISICF